MRTDRERILRFARKMGLKISTFTDPQCICEDAREAGAVESISFEYGKDKHYSNLNFELNKKGRCIGFSTEVRNSFRRKT